MGSAAKSFVPELLVLLKAKPPHTSGECDSRCSGRSARTRKEALTELKKLAESDPRPELKTLAIEAVKKIEAK